MGIRLVQAVPGSLVQVIERELPIELIECGEHDALDGYDSKELPVLHGRDGTPID